MTPLKYVQKQNYRILGLELYISEYSFHGSQVVTDGYKKVVFIISIFLKRRKKTWLPRIFRFGFKEVTHGGAKFLGQTLQVDKKQMNTWKYFLILCRPPLNRFLYFQKKIFEFRSPYSLYNNKTGHHFRKKLEGLGIHYCLIFLS